MKEYTTLRKFYAWVGFIFVLIALVTISAFITVLSVNSVMTYVATEEIEEKPTRSMQIWVESNAEVSAYSSEVAQTDSTPFISASGKRVFDGMIANNCHPFGTIVEIEGKEYIVLDRMNSRYGCEHYDIWFESKEDALEWGRKDTKVITPLK